MSTFLDIEQFTHFVSKHFGSESVRRIRLVGAERRHDSWYFDIVRFFGNPSIDPSSVCIERELGSFIQNDSIIAAFSDKIEHMLRAEGRIYDGPPVAGVSHVTWSPDSASLSIRPIRYGDQAASFAMDFPDSLFDRYGGTLREYLLGRYPSPNIETWPLGTGLGVCGHLLITEEWNNYILLARRSAKLASLENSFGASAAGSIEFELECSNLAEMTVESLSREVQEELGLENGEFTVTPLAYAREMVRGNRPQLFGVIRTELNRSQISERIAVLPESRREFSEFHFLPMQHHPIGNSEITQFNFEGKMCYYLLEEWLASR